MDEKPQVQKKRGNPIINALYISFWAAILIMFISLFFNQMESYNERQTELARMNTNLARERAENERLLFELSLFNSDAHIEQLARERLGMVRPNEIVFRNIAE